MLHRHLWLGIYAQGSGISSSQRLECFQILRIRVWSEELRSIIYRTWADKFSFSSKPSQNSCDRSLCAIGFLGVWIFLVEYGIKYINHPKEWIAIYCQVACWMHWVANYLSYHICDLPRGLTRQHCSCHDWTSRIQLPRDPKDQWLIISGMSRTYTLRCKWLC